jgi:hypothetical protein
VQCIALAQSLPDRRTGVERGAVAAVAVGEHAFQQIATQKLDPKIPAKSKTAVSPIRV